MLLKTTKMKNVLLTLTALIAIVSIGQSQTQTNYSKLHKLAKQFDEKWNADRAEVLKYSKAHNIPVRIENDSVTMELQHIDEFGRPQYYITENKNAAATVSTNLVNSGGGIGYSLDGTGMTVHEWDGGAVLATHQEFDSRVTQGDGATTTHYHSTHVAGTMIASGVDANAKGMAPQANLRAFEWNNDESEMASEAATNNTLVSNHSYGYSRGWVYNSTSGTWSWYGTPAISDQEDYLFGFYDDQASDWDEIAYNAPYYLIVKSAGNDRGDGPSNPPYPLDGPYDCISHSGLSKNVLTVGAVYDIPTGYQQASDVVMSSFSSWGPADDGRIKPDIVANGVGLYSSTNSGNSDYLSLNGTSMASPNAAGSMILLQEHYEDLNGTGVFMKASTLKALVIHTADEAGTDDGPDYQFGWGLLNTEKAVRKITEDQTNDVISEHTLTNGSSYTTNLTATSGYPIKVTIVWTDPKGTPVGASLDPTDVMLVNDLDLRITDQSTNTFYPWKLDGLNPSNAATRTSENDVDNVEVVLIESPTPGETYTITVDHDGTLASSQDFSMIISGYAAAPIANFDADITIPDLNETVTFSDLSENSPTSWSWSISPETYTFVNSTSASSQNPEVEFSEIGFYSITLEATNSNGNGTRIKTDYILVSNAPTNYCDAYSTNPAGYIESFHFGTTENNYSGYENIGSDDPNDMYYQDFTKTVIDALVDNTYSLYVLNGYNGTNEDLLDLSVWIDFNRDGDFDDTDEQIVCDPDDYGEGTFSVTIPSNANLGYTRMRVRTKYSGSDCGSTCGSTANGEVEDYTVNLRAETLTWQGSVSTDWDNPLNWLNGTVPTTEHDVVIPDASTVTFSPVINVGVSAVCADCSVEPGGSLIINGTLTLNTP